MRALFFSTFAAIALIAVSSVHASRQDAGRIDVIPAATSVLKDFTSNPANAIPDVIRDAAKAVMVFPQAEPDDTQLYRGRGVISLRGEERSNDWSAPSVLTLKHVSMPTTLVAIDLMILVMDRRGLFYLSQDAIEPDDSIPLQPGPIGKNAGVRIKANVFCYARFGNVIGGVTLRDISAAADKGTHEALYGRPFGTRDLLFGRPARYPDPVVEWREALAALMS